MEKPTSQNTIPQRSYTGVYVLELQPDGTLKVVADDLPPQFVTRQVLLTGQTAMWQMYVPQVN